MIVLCYNRKSINGGKRMFENIIVSAELLPIRESASKGNLAAMCQLARHIIDGDQTKLSTEMVERICTEIVQHQDLESDIERIRDLCKLMADCYFVLHEEGKLDTKEARKQMRIKLKELVFWTVQLPFEQWDIVELKHCVEWLYHEELEPIEKIE